MHSSNADSQPTSDNNMNAAIKLIRTANQQFERVLDFAAPAFQLAIRLHVANIFLKSGLTKINDFSSTIALFESEYQVPFISPELAAYFGTGAELLLPILFALGIFSRPTALALFVFNIVAVVSYADISAAGKADHFFWGGLMLVIVFFGAGRLSVDGWWKSRVAVQR